MVRAAHSLLSITHSMKLLLLLSDENQTVLQRDRELEQLRSQSNEAKTRVADLLDELIQTAGQDGSGPGSQKS